MLLRDSRRWSSGVDLKQIFVAASPRSPLPLSRSGTGPYIRRSGALADRRGGKQAEPDAGAADAKVVRCYVAFSLPFYYRPLSNFNARRVFAYFFFAFFSISSTFGARESLFLLPFLFFVADVSRAALRRRCLARNIRIALPILARAALLRQREH